MGKPRCKDCVVEGVDPKGRRKLAANRSGRLQPGPRCVTHHRARRKQTKQSAWESRIGKTYGITLEQYEAILEAQDGKCAICQRATGMGKKKLSVDHCHNSGMVRGILCNPCNRDVLGHLRDDTEALARAILYLQWPPALGAIGWHEVPELD